MITHLLEIAEHLWRLIIVCLDYRNIRVRGQDQTTTHQKITGHAGVVGTGVGQWTQVGLVQRCRFQHQPGSVPSIPKSQLSSLKAPITENNRMCGQTKAFRKGYKTAHNLDRMGAKTSRPIESSPIRTCLFSESFPVSNS